MPASASPFFMIESRQFRTKSKKNLGGGPAAAKVARGWAAAGTVSLWKQGTEDARAQAPEPHAQLREEQPPQHSMGDTEENEDCEPDRGQDREARKRGSGVSEEENNTCGEGRRGVKEMGPSEERKHRRDGGSSQLPVDSMIACP